MAVTTSRHDLLPGNATQLERDMVRASHHAQRIGSVARIRDAKYVDIPDDVLPWLVYEYNLGPVSDYIDDLRQVLALGIPWQRIRGTPESIREAVSWLSYSATLDETEEAGTSRWPDYHLGLATTPLVGDLRDIAYLANLSTPARGSLQRVYAFWDFRRFVLDDDLLSGGALLSDHSGIRGVIDGYDDVQVSIGDHRIIDMPSGVDGPHLQSVLHAGSNSCPERFILDECSILDEHWHMLNCPSTRVVVHVGGTAAVEGDGWSLLWADGAWDDMGAVPFGGVYTAL